MWHPDGNIELRDRGKDIIISGGENISSIEVEQTITAHPRRPGVRGHRDPHPHWGERPEAFVTLNEGAAATEQEIIAFCRDRLAHYKCPDAIQFGPLPKTPTGKIQKFVLREPEWKGQDKRISCLGGFGVVLSAGEVLGVVEQAVGQVVGGSARGGR